MPAPRRALVVVDVQNEYVDGPLEIQHPPHADSLPRVLEALATAERHAIPVVVVLHELPAGAPVFATGSVGQQLHPDVAAHAAGAALTVTKQRASAFAGTSLGTWVAEQGVDRLVLVGYMTNNCVLATASAAADMGIAVEVLSDATGAIDLSNDAGTVSARQVHETLMALLHSNFAAVATTSDWVAAVERGEPLVGSDLGTSAVRGRAAFA